VNRRREENQQSRTRNLHGSAKSKLALAKVYSIRVRQMLFWNKLMAIALAVLLNVPILLIGELVPIGDAVRAIVFSSLFLAGYFVFVRHYRLDEIELLVSRVMRKGVALILRPQWTIRLGNSTTFSGISTVRW